MLEINYRSKWLFDYEYIQGCGTVQITSVSAGNNETDITE